jgi:hypothetical protein
VSPWSWWWWLIRPSGASVVVDDRIRFTAVNEAALRSAPAEPPGLGERVKGRAQRERNPERSDEGAQWRLGATLDAAKEVWPLPTGKIAGTGGRPVTTSDSIPAARRARCRRVARVTRSGTASLLMFRRWPPNVRSGSSPWRRWLVWGVRTEGCRPRRATRSRACGDQRARSPPNRYRRPWPRGVRVGARVEALGAAWCFRLF